MNILEEFLDDEISSRELYEDVVSFIESVNIRNGEFEGNRYIIKKMDILNFIIYPEDIYPNGTREISGCISIYKKQLLDRINDYARGRGLI